MSDRKYYKAFDKDLKCRGFQYEIGATYSHDGELKICSEGFHFCQNIMDVYNYYNKSEETRVCEVEPIGRVLTEGDKSCTDKIKIVRELTHKELLSVWIKEKNSGNWNSGDWNSGNCNSGDWNSGNRNSGYWNSGNWNSGNRNSGHYNSGNVNSGDWNSGHYNSGNVNSGSVNSGHYNSGDWNSGDWNSGHYNSGYFNSNTPFVRMFNRETKLKWNDPIIMRLNQIIDKVKPRLRWIVAANMTDEEKAQFPSYKTTGGYLKDTGKHDWSDVSAEDFDFIRSLPNFDAEVFKACTGVEL